MMEPNGEQPYAPPIILRQGMARTKRPAPADEMLDDDSLFEKRKPSSARVYRSRHAAVKLTEPPIVMRIETNPKRRLPVSTWITSIGLGMAAMFLVIVVGNMVVNWFQSAIAGWQYGDPPTYQCDANVGHGGVSHFIVENLHDHIVIIEVLTDHLDKTKLYDGPVLLGKGATTAVPTLRFEDVNHNGLPEMQLTVDNALYVYNNDGNVFHAAGVGGKNG
ncbi:MAG TPA: hypothetical protein VKY19_14350 [Ktedonosporobacter sp.]|jgi:hypothetical protein|nr:hypothetical protein [Ktedonosporobacter sp.]